MKFFYEGEEEIGSVHLGPWVEKNKDLIKADAMHCLDGTVDSFAKVPEVELGLKSVLFIELIARGGKKDIHSLNFPLVPSPPWELVHALSTIMDRNRRILIKDWYEGLYELGEEEINLIVQWVDEGATPSQEICMNTDACNYLEEGECEFAQVFYDCDDN